MGEEIAHKRKAFERPREIRIWVVDDHTHIANTIASICSHAGYQAKAWYSGLAVVQALQDEDMDYRPHLIISDVHMERCNGFHILDFVQTHCPSRNVLLLSADSDLAFDTHLSGGVWFVQKPFTKAIAQSLIHELNRRVQIDRHLNEAGEIGLRMLDENQRLASMLNAYTVQFEASSLALNDERLRSHTLQHKLDETSRRFEEARIEWRNERDRLKSRLMALETQFEHADHRCNVLETRNDDLERRRYADGNITRLQCEKRELQLTVANMTDAEAEYKTTMSAMQESLHSETEANERRLSKVVERISNDERVASGALTSVNQRLVDCERRIQDLSSRNRSLCDERRSAIHWKALEQCPRGYATSLPQMLINWKTFKGMSSFINTNDHPVWTLDIHGSVSFVCDSRDARNALSEAIFQQCKRDIGQEHYVDIKPSPQSMEWTRCSICQMLIHADYVNEHSDLCFAQ